MIKSRQGNASARSIGSHLTGRFPKDENFPEKYRFFRNFEVSKKEGKEGRGSRGTLRVLRAETWLTVYRTIAMTLTVEVFPPLEE